MTNTNELLPPAGFTAVHEAFRQARKENKTLREALDIQTELLPPDDCACAPSVLKRTLTGEWNHNISHVNVRRVMLETIDQR